MVNHSEQLPPGAGKSSFELIDSSKFLEQLPLDRGIVFLDMGCGKGEYILALSEILGNEALLYGVDLWEEGITFLKQQVSLKNIHNIKALVADLGKGMPLESHSIDLCLMATVLHDLVQTGAAENALKEAARVVKPQGFLCIVEFNKVEGPPGPPVHIRLRPEEVEKLVVPHGFRKTSVVAIGPYNYMILFSVVSVQTS